MATKTPAARKRGRPRGTTKPKSSANTGIAGYVRDNLAAMLDTCPNCHRPKNSVAPLAVELGVTAQTLAAFIKGEANVQLDTFNRFYEFVENWKKEQANPASEEAVVSA